MPEEVFGPVIGDFPTTKPTIAPPPPRPIAEGGRAEYLRDIMLRRRRGAVKKYRKGGEIAPWETFYYANFPETAAYWAKQRFEKLEPEEDWGDWFLKTYPDLARQYGWEAKPVPFEEPEEDTWATWLRGAPKYARRIKTVGF